MNIISNTIKGKSKLFVGPIPLIASEKQIKQSKFTDKERATTLWTPVLIYPTGFSIEHKK